MDLDEKSTYELKQMRTKTMLQFLACLIPPAITAYIADAVSWFPITVLFYAITAVLFLPACFYAVKGRILDLEIDD